MLNGHVVHYLSNFLMHSKQKHFVSSAIRRKYLRFCPQGYFKYSAMIHDENIGSHHTNK